MRAKPSLHRNPLSVIRYPKRTVIRNPLSGILPHAQLYHPLAQVGEGYPRGGGLLRQERHRRHAGQGVRFKAIEPVILAEQKIYSAVFFIYSAFIFYVSDYFTDVALT